jgi:maltose alpha-D-glucosyltransferase/alpha-amylase
VNPQRLILPIIIDPEYHYEALNVEMQQSNPNSLLWWTKRLIALRKRFRAFGRGSVEFLHPANPRVLAFVRRFRNETILVVANLSRHVQYVELDLAAMKGAIPVELFGRTRFPTIAETPYMLTLGGHDFYWFTIEAPRHTEQEERMSLHGVSVISCSSVEDLLFGSEKPLLEEVLPAFLDARGWLSARGPVARIVESIRLAPDVVLLFVRVEYDEGEPDTFALPLVAVKEVPTDAQRGVVASLLVQERASMLPGESGGSGEPQMPLTMYLVEGTVHGAATALVDAIVRGGSFTASGGRVVAAAVTQAALDGYAERDVRVISSDRLGASIAFGQSFVLKLFYRMEEGRAPELEVGRYMEAKGFAGITPNVLGWVEYNVPRVEPVTLAVVEEFVQNEGTAWQQARSDMGRAYERILAHPADAPVPSVPREPLLELAARDIPPEHSEIIGAYADWATLLGKRIAALHRALAAGSEPAFEPHGYSAMDQRSKYQNARNLIGRVIAGMRRSFAELPRNVQPIAESVLAHENEILARFEPLLTQRIDSQQIRHHGDLHLGRVLFTGKDYVIVGVGGGRDRRLSERRRKGSALRDVAGIVRSFHYAAATTLLSLRPEDHVRAEPWGWIWQRWAAAAYLRGYVEDVKDMAFLPQSPQMLSVLLETALIEKAFAELRGELGRRPEMAWIPLQGIARLMNLV